jgi:hypothetical protein
MVNLGQSESQVVQSSIAGGGAENKVLSDNLGSD